ncbi:hypothetical protein PAMP_011182 [Pampus punctatissimus]
MHVKNGDIDQWRKQVEMASEFAVSEVFSHKKPQSRSKSVAVPLQSSDQLRAHDDAYSEAQALLCDWLGSKLRLELETEDEEDDLTCSAAALATAQPAALNFDDLYNQLAEEEEYSAVNSILQDLMEQEVLDSGMMEELALDVGQTRKKFRDPIITMEVRHQQVRENRARREAEKQRQQRERETLWGARKEAMRREREEERRKKQEARRQEEMVQKEMVRLRREMEERRGLEQLVRQRTEKTEQEMKLELQEFMVEESEDHHSSGTSAPDASSACHDKTPVGAQPTQPWQVSRRHVAPTAAELHEIRQRGKGSKRAVSSGSRFENRHVVQQQIITQQRKLLKEQQEQIARLKEEQSMIGLELEAQKTVPLTQLSVPGASKPKSQNFDPTEQRSRVTGEPESLCAPQRKAVTRPTCPHPIITEYLYTQLSLLHLSLPEAMEVRAHQRAERKKEIEELKRKKEEEKLAEMKAAEEQRQREEEEEKRKAAEKRREEKRQEKEREEEKHKQLKRQQELLKLAHQHYHRTLLLRRGLAPWKRLIQLRQSNTEMKDWRMIQEERAKRFYRTRTLRRFLLALLDHVTQERLAEWDSLELAQEHNNSKALECRGDIKTMFKSKEDSNIQCEKSDFCLAERTGD